MAIYSALHSGVSLNATTLTNLNLKEADLRGYFSKSVLENLINNNSDCVGLRIYNVNPNIAFSALLAVCVLDNGADMQNDGTHATCAPIDVASDSADLSPRLTSYNTIKAGYTFDVNESEKFSSFFSKAMLQNLLTGSSHSGLAFYKVIWLGGHSTHLAVTSNLGNTNSPISIFGLNGTGFNHILSDQPCPGHCTNFDASGNEIIAVNPVIVPKDDLTGPYIPIWD